MLAELLAVSAVTGLSVAAVLCPWCQWLCRAGLLLVVAPPVGGYSGVDLGDTGVV